jgi:predicted acylesterase/phospholipase RssA
MQLFVSRRALARSRMAAAFILALTALLVAGCASTVRQAVPPQLTNQVDVVDFSSVRRWGDEPPRDAQLLAQERRTQIAATRPELLDRSRRHAFSFLVLSGGGHDGAYGAGILNGWTAAGNRPEFEVVTGVSTGALIAPLAFLGPEYDPQLKEIYTQYSTRDLLTPSILGGLFGGSSLTSSQPLYELISKYVDRKFLAAVAREHNRGRRLLIGTTNLDAERSVVWDMGKIAQHNSPEALKLFRQIMMASVSIPGLFPPVYIDVKIGNQTYQEMHVDGGTTDNAFLLPANFSFEDFQDREILRNNLKLYLIVNSKTSPEAKPVNPTTFSVAGRSISTLIKQQTAGDVIQIYLSSQKNNIAFHLASVPSDFNHENNEPFDIKYMTALYELGYRQAKSGYEWQRKPPGF